MSNEVKTKEKVDMDPKYIAKLAVTLLVTCVVVAGLLVVFYGAVVRVEVEGLRGAYFYVGLGVCQRQPARGFVTAAFARRVEGEVLRVYCRGVFARGAGELHVRVAAVRAVAVVR